jgi:phage terminase large subunit-like protein
MTTTPTGQKTTPGSRSPRRRSSEAALPPTLGPVVCRWIENYLVHGEGDFLGQPFLLEAWQKKIIYRLYEYKPETGRRLVRRALIILPKGCGAIVTKAVTHDGNPRLAAHMANAVTKETPDGAYITKEDRHSSRKIDLAVAAVIAFGRTSTVQEPAEPLIAFI